MPKTLIEKHGTFRNVCKYMSQGVPEQEQESFIEWMMLQEKYSPSYYSKGLFADSKLYYHNYAVYKKMKSGNNQQHIILVSGKVGKGKSTLGLQTLAMVDPSIDMTRVCYIPPHFFSYLATAKPSKGCMIDEGGNFFKARNAMTKMGKDISAAYQLIRDLQQINVICYDEIEKMDKDILEKVDTLLVKVPEPSEKGDRKYRRYYGFNASAILKIMPLIKKKIPLHDPRILKFSSWQGHHSQEIPTINDIDEKVYRENKRKYLQDHMKVLADKYADEYKDLIEDKAETLQETKVSGVPDEINQLKKKHQYITAREICEMFRIERTTITKWHNKYGIGKRVGQKLLFTPQDVENIENNSFQAPIAL